MAKRPSSFRQQDVTRALKSARAAGLDVARYEIDAAGKIVVVVSEDAPKSDSALEKWRQDRARAS